jgi:hypothetical protein
MEGLEGELKNSGTGLNLSHCLFKEEEHGGGAYEFAVDVSADHWNPVV